jgi:hypothetical protein
MKSIRNQDPADFAVRVPEQGKEFVFGPGVMDPWKEEYKQSLVKDLSPEARLVIVNAIIQEIASRGRRFFYDKDTNKVANFFTTGKKVKIIWFEDKNGAVIRIGPKNKNEQHYDFSGGGTLWGLVHEFSEFIATGEYTNGNSGYGGLYGGGWGYPEEDMEAIRNYAKSAGYLK